jgi:TonB family protein
MTHGIEAFFTERARARRRVATNSVLTGTVLLAALGTANLPPVSRALRQTRVLRFGFEGPPRYVRLVEVEARPGLQEPLRDIGQVSTTARGAAGAPRPAEGVRVPRRRTSTPDVSRDPGSRGDLVARALASQSQVPIFQSNDLIIERLVRPTYPEDARDQGLEGKVAVLARVDTAGQVIEAEVMTGSGTLQLDRAAEEAVRQCRFRPYRVAGEAREVYAVFRFAFRIY